MFLCVFFLYTVNFPYLEIVGTIELERYRDIEHKTSANVIHQDMKLSSYYGFLTRYRFTKYGVRES